MKLKGSGDGVPASYFQAKCFADDAFSNKDYAEAAKHYEKASSIRFFEAPNYELRLEWSESLCLAGEKEDGKKVLETFFLMAKADLGEFECPEKTEELKKIIQQEHMALACVGFGSSLSEKGKVELTNKLKRVPEIKAMCNDA
ncbi:hypothetical protein [Aliikangiella sp. IMCC44632]